MRNTKDEEEATRDRQLRVVSWEKKLVGRFFEAGKCTIRLKEGTDVFSCRVAAFGDRNRFLPALLFGDIGDFRTRERAPHKMCLFAEFN